MPPNKEADAQFKITAKRSSDMALLPKISIPSRKISNYGTNSLLLCGVVWALSAKPAWHIAAHHANFWAGAVAKVQLILRSCGSGAGAAEQMVGLEAWSGTPHVLWRGRLCT